jgi:hypothetical protein
MKLLPILFMNCVIGGCEDCEIVVIPSESASPAWTALADSDIGAFR